MTSAPPPDIHSAAQALGHFISKGFQHIVPHGPDHVMFLVGLFLLCRHFPTLVWQTTLFTLAHSAAFGMALLGWLALPEVLVESAICVSIIFIGLEAWRPVPLIRWRSLFILVCGLIHGAAFAHTLKTTELPKGQVIPSVLGFNLGIEISQLALITAFTALAAPHWHKPWYTTKIVRPLSAILAFLGLLWLIFRLVA